MAELKDSGARRDFGTGAVRDVADGKGRCDLLPLAVIDKLLPRGEGDPLAYIEDYLRGGNIGQLIGAINNFTANHCTNIYTGLLEAAKQYEDGCQKYGERNWENGIPLHCYIDSGVRHYLKFLRGDTDEPHDRAFLWNMLGAIWTHENKPELIDLPFAAAGNPATPITTEDKPVEPWGEWISVNDAMPEPDVPVLVTYIGFTDNKPHSDGIAIWSQELNGYNGGWEWTLDYSEVTVEITHWFPLPKPPKEE